MAETQSGRAVAGEGLAGLCHLRLTQTERQAGRSKYELGRVHRRQYASIDWAGGGE